MKEDIQNQRKSNSKYTKFGIAVFLFITFIFFLFYLFIFKPEIIENFKLSFEKLPEEYKSYQYLEDIGNTNDFEVIHLNAEFYNDPSYTFLSDSTLILNAGKEGIHRLFRIDKKGNITDSCRHNGLYFDGYTLLDFEKGIYSYWPINGEKAEYKAELLEDMDTIQQKEIYYKANIILIEKRVYMQTGQKWYSSNIETLEKRGIDVSAKKPVFTHKSLKSLYEYDKMKFRYLKRIEYNPPQMSGYLQGGSGKPASWDGDVFLDLVVGDKNLPFKQKDFLIEDIQNPDVILFILETPEYIIIENCIVKIK